MDQERILENQDVVVSMGKIVAVGGSGQVTYNDDATIVDGTGKYLIPGLAEMHAHVPPIDDMEPMKDVLSLFLAKGITTIRGMLGHPLHLELRKKLESRTDGFVIIQRKHYTTPGGFRIFRDVRNAISREKQIKGGSRAKKIELINGMNAGGKDLYDGL